MTGCRRRHIGGSAVNTLQDIKHWELCSAAAAAPGICSCLGGLARGGRLLLCGCCFLRFALPVGFQGTLELRVLLLPQPPVEILSKMWWREQ